YPPTCHRLGLGKDVGCQVEHADVREAMGDDGYTLDDAAKVTRERAGTVGVDLFGFAPFFLLAFVPLLLRPSRRAALASAFIVAMTLAYGLFYYGSSSTLHGARHIFLVAPFAYVLVA